MVILFALLILALAGCALLYIRYQLNTSYQQKHQQKQINDLTAVVNALQSVQQSITAQDDTQKQNLSTAIEQLKRVVHETQNHQSTT